MKNSVKFVMVKRTVSCIADKSVKTAQFQHCIHSLLILEVIGTDMTEFSEGGCHQLGLEELNWESVYLSCKVVFHAKSGY